MTVTRSTWLSPEWFGQVKSLADGEACRPGVSGRIQVQMAGGPEGDASSYWVLEKGALEDAAQGSLDNPDVTLTLSWKDGRAIWQGELDPSVAFMQGRLKVAGSMGIVLSLFPGWRDPSSAPLRQRIVDSTEF
jgi:hypothetical protein